MRASKLIEKLQKLIKKHGDLKVLYASDYDWAMNIKYATVEEDPGWGGAPKGPAIYLN